MNKKQIKYYVLNNGKSPFLQWKQSLDKKNQVKIDNRIVQLISGNYSNCSVLKNTDGVKESKLRTSSGIRLYFGEDENSIILLLIGGDKDTQEKDIKKAKEYWKDYKKGDNLNG